MDRMSKQEYIIGALSVSPLLFKLGLEAIWLLPLCGILWAMGGTFNKSYRRLLIPFLVVAYSMFNIATNYWFLLCLPLGFAILSIGDGFPDTRPTTKDEGSVLGRFVAQFLTDDEGGGFITKAIIPIILQLAWLPIYVS